MKILYKGLLLGLLQIGIVSSLGAKLLYDRAHRPRVWIKSAIYDPNLPIRGKYLALNIEVPAEGFTGRMQTLPYASGPKEYEFFSPSRCDLVLRGNQLIAVANEQGEFWVNVSRRNHDVVAVINGETAYFLPEHQNGPVLRNRGDELWIEATIPRKGPPRPIRLGIKRDGVLTPLPTE
ncbi:MAG: hypothetical protein DMG92_12965 [Acidobacteria bacterium]|nr:MAG: hypothetical protein DMG92_12965 [Acidobacteriota bacterium]